MSGREHRGFTCATAEEDGEAMKQPPEYTWERRRLLFRKKGYLAGWRELSCDVGDCRHHLETMNLVCAMIKEDGESPADYEFRIDYAPQVRWIEGEIIDGASVRQKAR